MYSGEDLEGQIETLSFFFHEKEQEYKQNVQEFEKRSSILEYFKKGWSFYIRLFFISIFFNLNLKYIEKH